MSRYPSKLSQKGFPRSPSLATGSHDFADSIAKSWSLKGPWRTSVLLPFFRILFPIYTGCSPPPPPPRATMFVWMPLAKRWAPGTAHCTFLQERECEKSQTRRCPKGGSLTGIAGFDGAASQFPQEWHADDETKSFQITKPVPIYEDHREERSHWVTVWFFETGERKIRGQVVFQ